MKRIISLALCAVLVLGLFAGASIPRAKAAEGWKYGLNGAMGWNEDTFYTISKRTTNNNWRQALASANGEIAFMESGDPNEDVFIFNNTKIVYDDNGVHEAPVLADIIDEQRAGAINYNRWVWNQAANSYDQQTYGISGGRGMVWSRPYMPAAQYRIKNNDYTSANRNNYNRWTNYETAEVGAQWRDADGNEWNRRSFASRADDIIVTYIEAPAGKNLDLTISMDHITDMRNEGTLDTLPATDYVVTQEGNKVVGFGTVGKFVTRNITGTKDNGKTLFSYGGWASSTRIVTEGDVAYTAATRTVAADRGFSVNQAFEANDPRLRVTGTDRIMLITKVDRQDDGCNTVDDVRRALYDRLQSEIAGLVSAKGIGCNEAGYQTLLAPHAAIHGGMFNNVRIELCQTDEEKADRELTNQRLIQKQNNDKTRINKAFLERVYNNGRYGLICAHGYGSTRLSAIWCGTWNPSWSGDYTLDANTNLQVSGLNTGNMAEAGQGYINFIVRMVADWEKNAERIYGMTDAILGPPRVDGTGQGQSYHYSDTYPHVFVNGITDWLLLPIFEYWQCYGNRKIALGKDIDPARNASVLDWSEADIARIRADGYYDLEEDVLFPMAMKAMNFWTQFADGKYYTDGQGRKHVNDGTTLSDAIAAGDDNARYIFAPGFSPENSPERGGASVQALAYNVSMDIAAAHDALFIARTMLRRVNPDDPRLAEWDEFEKRIPEYLYEPNTGELKEWASYDLKEAHNHRHESHAYAAWPGYEAQDDKAVREGLAIAMDRRSAAYNGQEATESHGATHKALVEARLKRPVALERVMLYLLTNGYQYSNMLTSHNRSNGSCLCTDSAFGLMGAVNESLLYSNTGIVEILPTLLPGFDRGSITGLRTRNNAQADIVWDKSANTAAVSLTTDENEASIKVLCGLEWTDVKLNGTQMRFSTDDQGRKYLQVPLTRGRTARIEFTLASAEPVAQRDAYGPIAAGSFDAQSGSNTPDADQAVEPDSFDYLVFKGLDFGLEGSKPRLDLVVKNDRTDGGLHRDGTATVRIFTRNPNDGSSPFAEAVIPNTGGEYKRVSLALPERLSGVQDVYIKFQDGGLRLKTLEFFPMPAANVTDGEAVSISAQKPLTLELNTDVFAFELDGSAVQNGYRITEPGEFTLVIRKDGELYKTVRFSTYVSEANRLLEKTVKTQPGEAVALTGRPGDPAVRLWLAPPDVHNFRENRYMTMSAGDSIRAPEAEGSYCLYAVNADGAILGCSDARVQVGGSGLTDVDFADPAGADAYEILGRTNARQTADGLVLRSTRNAVEPCNGQNSGDQANTPEDMVRIPVEGDWIATLKFDFDPTANNGYYQFFGFYAAEGGDFQNMAGIRGGDGALQNFLRVGGSITADSSEMNSTPGLASAGTYWFRIEKDGDSYVCYRSENGGSFAEIFRYERTGIEADSILIDAYTGMTEGYTFTLKNLHFEGQVVPHVHSYAAEVTPATCAGTGFTTYTCAECGDWYLSGDIPALGHDFGAWQVSKAATCEAAGEETRTCTRCGEKESRAVPAPGHDWGEPTYVWAADNKTVEARRVCSRDAAHVESETAAVQTEITKPATTEAPGEAVHTAVFRNPAFAAQTRVELIPELDKPLLPCDGGGSCPGRGFADMPPKGNWAHDAIDWAVVKKITTGTSASAFSPDRGCTRAQVVTFLWRAAGEPEPVGKDNPFKDVKEGQYYYSAVLWAVEKGITKGTSDDAFSPDSTCTRGQIVTFLWRNAGSPAPEKAAAQFRDVPAGAYFADAVAWAAEQGVTTGTSADTFSPNATCTRAQVVTFLYRSLVK